MTPKEAIDCLKNEKLCILIADKNECTRECSKCDLVMETDTLLTAYDMAIEALEKQIPKRCYKDNENGVYEKEYCPTCHRSLFPNDHHCKCGQAIDWGEEE